MDIDLGPADFTGRNIDVTGAGPRRCGINPRAFPTVAIGRVAEVVSNALSKAGSKAKGIPQKAKKHGTTAGFSFPGGSGPMAGINFNSFKQGAPSPPRPHPRIKALVGKINGMLDPNAGTAAASLSDRISATSQIDDQAHLSEYQAANPYTDASTGLIACSPTPASGATSHTLDQAFVSMRIAELQQLIQWQIQLRDQLKANSLARIAELVGRIQSAIATRRLYIANKVRDQIAGEHRSGYQRCWWTYEKNAEADPPARSRTLAASISAAQNQNKQLGGDAMRVGTGGIIGKVSGEIDSASATSTVGTLSDPTGLSDRRRVGDWRHSRHREARPPNVHRPTRRVLPRRDAGGPGDRRGVRRRVHRHQRHRRCRGNPGRARPGAAAAALGPGASTRRSAEAQQKKSASYRPPRRSAAASRRAGSSPACPGSHGRSSRTAARPSAPRATRTSTSTSPAAWNGCGSSSGDAGFDQSTRRDARAQQRQPPPPRPHPEAIDGRDHHPRR